MAAHRAAAPLVLADDLSGATECAVLLSRAGLDTLLALDAADAPRHEGALVVDLDNRTRHRSVPLAVAARLRGSALRYLKVDSLLRGRWATFVADAVAAAGGPAVICPALPRLGRAVADGRIALTDTERARLAGAARHADDITAALADAGLRGTRVGAAAGDAGTEAAAWRDGFERALAHADALVVDAASDAQLDALADALLARAPAPLAVGSAGLLAALTRRLVRAQPARPSGAAEAPGNGTDGSTLPRSVLVAVGSDSATAREQLAAVAAAFSAPILEWHPSSPTTTAAQLEPRPMVALHAIAADASLPAGGGEALSRAFARALVPAIERSRTIVVTGGETARAVCESLGIGALRMLGEVEPGVCIAATDTRPHLRLVIKSGTFGDRETLLRAVRLACPTDPRPDGASDGPQTPDRPDAR